MLSTLREGDISTLSNRGHFYFALTAHFRAHFRAFQSISESVLAQSSKVNFIQS
jgi:hypothetical protein